MLEINQVRAQMLSYIQNTLEATHRVFSGLPICPFARAARLQNKIEIWVHPFTVLDWSANSLVYRKIQRFLQCAEQDVLLIVHPDPEAIRFSDLNQFVERLNETFHPFGLIVFGGHPEDAFEVNGFRTRRDPFINFTVQKVEKLLSARKSLAQNTNYYKLWDKVALETVGFKQD
jgi:hypothetical protein